MTSTDSLDHAIDTYFAAWNESDPVRREHLPRWPTTGNFCASSAFSVRSHRSNWSAPNRQLQRAAELNLLAQ